MTFPPHGLLQKPPRLCFGYEGGSEPGPTEEHAFAARPAFAAERGGSDALRFLLEWLFDPVGTAAVAPSGKALVSLITGGIDGAAGRILELGSGTGAFTRGLIARGVAERDLTLVEQNPNFARLLKARHPQATVLRIDAADLTRHRPSAGDAFGAAVCGLGLRNMAVEQVEAIMRAAFASMTAGAPFYLFTYGRRCPVPDVVLVRLHLVAERTGTTFRNLPPASVYRVASAVPVR